MTITTDAMPTTKRRIDANGPDGNAFSLLSMAIKWSKQLGFSKEKTDSIIYDMKSSDYNHLINVFDSHFGEFVILHRSY